MEHLEAAPGKAISQPTMERSLNLAGALEGHALAAFNMMGGDPDLEAAKHALAWIRRERKKRFTARDCHRALAGRYKRAAESHELELLRVKREEAQAFPASGSGR